MPSPVGGLGACPLKKNRFCTKNYAILSKFWYFFPIGLLQHKVGGLSPVLKVGDLSPCPPAPTPMSLVITIVKEQRCLTVHICQHVGFITMLSYGASAASTSSETVLVLRDNSLCW